jgi:hypothetical protein
VGALEAADIEAEIVKRLKLNEDRRMRGDFAGVHAAPSIEARLREMASRHPEKVMWIDRMLPQEG